MQFLALLLVCLAGAQAAKLTERFAWKQMEYAWQSPAAKEQAIQKGIYIPENNLPLGLARWKNKLFITVPRWKAGVAASLNYIMVDGDKSQPLIPYPSWSSSLIEPSAKTITNNETIISVFRLWVDACDRLWVMDTGLADIYGKGVQMAPPSLVIFDLNTDTLIRRYFFKPEDSEESSFFANVNVDVTPGQCEDAYAYVPDLGAYAVVVYSFRMDKSWRARHHYFHFEPLQGQYNVGGVEFQWTDGVFSLALGPIKQDGFRNVMFHALSSTKEFMVSSEILRNETWATSMFNFHDFTLLGDKGPNSQTSASYYDDTTGVLFYTQVNRDGIACWNSRKPFEANNLVLIDSDSKTMEFPNDLKVDSEGNLWVLSDRMPKFLFKSLDNNDFNYRIFLNPTKSVIAGTPCS